MEAPLFEFGKQNPPAAGGFEWRALCQRIAKKITTYKALITQETFAPLRRSMA
jgi:hypothetical protein